MKQSFDSLKPGQVFRLADFTVLKTAKGCLSLRDFSHYDLPGDAQIEVIGSVCLDDSGNKLPFLRSTFDLKELLKECLSIVEDGQLDWSERYNKIFLHPIVPGAQITIYNYVRAAIDLKYVDPDMSYEEDTRAFVSAFQEAL